ncbi:MAG: hypothetical protein ABJQ29_00485 [Luteolibacter sp.]
MPVSSIAQIFIRLYAVKLFVAAVASFGGLLSMTNSIPFDLTNFLYGSLPNAVIIACGVFLWLVAPPFSRWLTKGGNGALSLDGLAPEHLFTAVFLGLGVYFVMDSFSNVFGWIHYFATNHADGVGGFHMDDEPSYYDLTERLLTMIGGGALIVTCRAFGRRIAKKYPSEQAGASDGDSAPV